MAYTVPYPITDVGPLIHAFTSGENNALILDQLNQFEAAVNNLTADGGGDHAEYALDAILAGLRYSVIDEYGNAFTPMSRNSKMVVITDAPSKNTDLDQLVIDTARRQGVSIHFILSRFTNAVYSNIASQTGGNVYSDSHSTWSIVNFQLGLPSVVPVPTGKRKRSAPRPTHVSFSVSLFTSSFRVSTYTPLLRSGSVNITTPNGVESANVEDNVLLYLRSDPTAGNYSINLGTVADRVVIQQDVSLDISLIYTDSSSTNSALNPPPACKFDSQFR